jgi:hypothetical protein
MVYRFLRYIIRGIITMATTKYRLIGGNKSAMRSFVSQEEKVRILADVYIKGVPPKEVLASVYANQGKKLPKNTSIVLSGWRKQIQARLDEGDTFVVELAKKYGMVEEEPVQ